MRYCPDCGTAHECEAAVAGVEKAEVAIEKLRTNRDIEVARINATAGVQISETEAEAGVAHAEGRAEGMEDAIEAVTGGGPAEGDGEPIVVETAANPVGEPDAIDEPEIEAPPEVAEVPASEGSGSSWWSGYR